MQLKAELIEVITQQRAKLEGHMLQASEWQLDCMPRYTALVNIGHAKLAGQVDSYKNSTYGVGGRERLAGELGWTVAAALHPKLTLQEASPAATQPVHIFVHLQQALSGSTCVTVTAELGRTATCVLHAKSGCNEQSLLL